MIGQLGLMSSVKQTVREMFFVMLLSQVMSNVVSCCEEL